jgi:hypothetical protein
MGAQVRLFKQTEVTDPGQGLCGDNRSFLLRDIRNVEVIYHHRNWVPELSLLAASAVCEAVAAATSSELLQVAAILLLMAAATVFWKGAPRYSLVVDSQNGRSVLLTSGDRFMVESLSQRLQATAAPSKRNGLAEGQRQRGHVVPFRSHSVYPRFAG